MLDAVDLCPINPSVEITEIEEDAPTTADMGEDTGPYHPAHRPLTQGEVRGCLLDGAEAAW